MRIAVIEPYYGGSHRAWADGLRDHSRHDVTLFTHEARFWKWRMHGSYVTLAAEFVDHVAGHGPFDVVLATDMLHLPAFLGAVGPSRGAASVALYMHENQLTYPLSPRDSVDEAYAMINWASMAVADEVFFNSQFHHDVWFARIPALLKRFPDYTHTWLLPSVAAKASVLPVGIDLARFDDVPRSRGVPPLVLWNQRWDFDKGPGEFADAMITAAETHDFRLAVAGEQVAELEDFTRLHRVLGERIIHSGHAAEPDYVALLAQADIVVSTATQEFFGIAVTEAIYAGAFPLLPNGLVYPERLPGEYHELCLYEPGKLPERLGWAIDHPQACTEVAAGLHGAMAEFDWKVMAPIYDDRLERLSAG